MPYNLLKCAISCYSSLYWSCARDVLCSVRIFGLRIVLMDKSSPLVLEISSDEEAGFGEARKGIVDVVDGEDCEWLSKLLCEVGGNINDDDDDDDVVFVSEVFPKPPKKSRSESLKPSVKVVDDDCVVLDGDPDKPLVVVNSKVEEDDDDDSDDVEIVGEKGEVACRDFPHPRHLCANFLFASTPHEVHCGQCHCYVCDSLAPCSQWGTGTSIIDHCHANDKEEYWRAERKHVKKADKSVPHISSTTSNGTYRIEAYFPTTQVPALTRPQPNCSAQNRGFNPVTIHPRPMPSNVIVPNSVNHARTHTPGYAVPRYKPQPQLVSLRSHPTRNNSAASRNNGHHMGTRNPESFPPRRVFKRHGFDGDSPNNRHAYGSQLSRGPSLKRCRGFQTPVINAHHSSNQNSVGSHAASLITQPRLSDPHSMSVGRPNYLPSHSQINSQPYLHSLDRDPMQYQSQTPAQPYANRNLSRVAPLEANIAPPQSVESTNNLVLPHVFHPSNPAPSQAVAPYQADDGNSFGNQLHSRSMISSRPDVVDNLEKHRPQPQSHYNPTSLLMDGQNDVQQGNQTQNGIDVCPTDSSFFLDSSLNHGNMQIRAEESQYQGTAPAETSQLQNEPKNDHHPSIELVDNVPRQSVVLADFTSPINDGDCRFPQSTDKLDFQFDNWMFENQPLSGAFEDSFSPNWNVYSPEPSFIDTGTLFDF